MNICHFLGNHFSLSIYTRLILVCIVVSVGITPKVIAQQAEMSLADKNLLIESNILYAQNFSPFQEDELDDFDEMDNEIESAFMQLDADLEAQFNALHEAIQRAFNSQTKKIEVEWPKDVVVPNGQVWVAYSPSLQERVVYDFEQGYYQIEVKASADTAKSLIKLREFAKNFEQNKAKNLQQMDIFGQAITQEVAKIKPIEPNLGSEPSQLTPEAPRQTSERAKLAPELAKLPPQKKAQVAQFPNPDNYQTIVAVTPPNFDNQVDKLLKSMADVTNNNADSEQSVSPSSSSLSLSEERVFTDTELARAMSLEQTESGWSIKVPFVNNFQQTLIDERMPTIIEMSEKYNVDVSLILAIIEAESSFNPMATSHIPAFGLMQLVPRTAGIDAYRHVYGYKKILSPDYLYDVDNNLELGTAYIDVLQSRYLRGITNEQNKLYSIVASYNTGVGNLAKTMTGKNRVRQAIGDINQLQPTDYFDYLQQNLPALETKNYLNKVLSKREKYQHLDGS